MQKFALLVGVSDYGSGLSSLRGSLKDIAALQRVLIHPQICAFEESKVKVLANPKRQQMEDAIFDLLRNLQKDDLVLLYFSGHGIKDAQSKYYLATCETRKTEQGDIWPSTAVRADFIQEQLSNSRSKRKIVILDSCFSGAFARGLKAKDGGRVDIRKLMGGEGRAVLASSSSVQYSFEQEGEELSIYTRYLIEGIRTGAADIDGDGYVSIDELHEYICRKVAKEAPAMTPEIHASQEGYTIRIAIAPIDDPKLKYRKDVESWVDLYLAPVLISYARQ